MEVTSLHGHGTLGTEETSTQLLHTHRVAKQRRHDPPANHTCTHTTTHSYRVTPALYIFVLPPPPLTKGTPQTLPEYSDPTQLPSTPPPLTNMHGMKGRTNTVISRNFLPPPPPRHNCQRRVAQSAHNLWGARCTEHRAQRTASDSAPRNPTRSTGVSLIHVFVYLFLSTKS